jgi:hemolysin III
MSIEVRFRILKDPWSTYTHFAGLVAALIGAGVLVAMTLGDTWKLTTLGLYGASLVAVFLASTLYHFFDIGERGNRWLRRFDHAAIFALIAGSYVPPLFHLLDGAWRTWMLTTVIGLATLGALFKVLWIDCPRWLGVGIYLVLGWVVVIPGYKILPQLALVPLLLLIAGGLAYSVGALVYLRQWPDPWPDRFGHHEVWHLFVLAGAAAHYGFALHFVDAPYVPI